MNYCKSRMKTLKKMFVTKILQPVPYSPFDISAILRNISISTAPVLGVENFHIMSMTSHFID